MCPGVLGEEDQRGRQRSSLCHEGPEESHPERYGQPDTVGGPPGLGPDPCGNSQYRAMPLKKRPPNGFILFFRSKH